MSHKKTRVDSDLFLSHARKTENLLKQMGLTVLYALLYSFVIYKLRKKIVYTLNLAIFEANAAPTFWSSPSLLRRQLMVTASSGVERWSFNMTEWPVWWLTAQQNYNTKETKNSTKATNLIMISPTCNLGKLYLMQWWWVRIPFRASKFFQVFFSSYIVLWLHWHLLSCIWCTWWTVALM